MLAWLLAILPMDGDLKRETVDCIELNRTYDECGQLVFTQWILWDWNGARHDVVAWRLDKPDMHFQERRLTLTWYEGGWRQVKAKYWRETWEQFDPELAEREILPKQQRRGIFGVKE